MKSKFRSAFQDPAAQEVATKISLTGLFLSIFAGFVSRLSFRKKAPREDRLTPFDLLLLGLSTLRLGRMISYDLVAEPVRRPFTRTVPDQTGAGDTVEPRGEGVQRSLGQLLSCPICIGTWIAAGLVYGLQILPKQTRVLLSIMGTMGLTEVLNEVTEAFTWTAQYTRVLSGEKMKAKSEQDNLSHLFSQGGNYYVGHDHEKYYRQNER